MGIAPFKMNELNSLRDDITKVFDSFFEKTDSTIIDYDFVPPINVIETNDKIIVEMEVPGVDKEEIEVYFSKNTLTIKGTKKSRTSGSDNLFHRIERNYGKFHRNITIPFAIEEEKINADVKKGVLTIVLNKKNEVNDRKIDIVFEE